MDGDVTGAVTVLDLPVHVQEAVLNGAQITIRGRMTLQLDVAELRALRQTVGHAPGRADDSLLGAYRQGLEITGRSLDDLEDGARALVADLLNSLRADLAAAELDVDASMPAIEAIVHPQLEALCGRMDTRRGTLALLEASLAEVGRRTPDGAAAELERILGEEYVVTSVAQSDLGAFEGAVRLVLSAAAERFGS